MKTLTKIRRKCRETRQFYRKLMKICRKFLKIFKFFMKIFMKINNISSFLRLFSFNSAYESTCRRNLVNQSLLFFIILLLLPPSARAQRAMTDSKQRISLFIKRAAGRILWNKPKLNTINGYIIILIYFLFLLPSAFNYFSTDAKELRLQGPLSLLSTTCDAAIILLFLAIMFTFPDLFTILYM